MIEKLLKPLPSEAISQHPTKPYLSSIKAIYVIERFNEVFGTGKWSIKVEKEYADYTTGMIVVKVIFEVKDLNIYYESFGGNDNGGINNKNFDLGDAYKGATTDAITKIGSYLGVGIDVFKGKSNEHNTEIKNVYTQKIQESKTWINDEQFNSEMIDLVKLGNASLIYKKLMEKYMVARRYRDLIDIEISKYNGTKEAQNKLEEAFMANGINAKEI